MQRKVWFFAVFVVVLLFMVAFSAFIPVEATEAEILEEEPVLVPLDDEESAVEQEGEPIALASEIIPATTTLLVTSGLDPDTSSSYSLTSNPDGLQTLRRAIISARNAPKPVEIRFNIPTSCPSYNSTLEIWTIQFAGQDSVGAAAVRQLNGQIWINGASQSGGRSWGPKIFLRSHNPSWHGIKMGGTSSDNGNRITGLAFQNFSDHVQVNSRENIVEDCWFGLDDHGTSPYLRNNSPAQGSGVSGVVFANVTIDNGNNIIRNNVFLGLNGTAATIRGRDNTFEDNYVGTRWDGIVPNPGCTPDNWLGGGGVTVQGRRHLIQNNTIAGLRFDQFDLSQPPDALKVTVDDIADAGHTIRWNTIGRDANDTVVGSCGRGIYLSNRMRGTLIEGNIIDSTSLPGMSLNGLLYEQCEFKENQIWRTSIEYGPQVRDSYKNFKPARVTSISGTTVSGTSGVGSPGPNCWIELFLDTTNNPVEAHQFLARVQADAEGNWTATIPVALSGNQGIRTTTTTTAFGTIGGTLAPTTTGLSEFYSATPPPRVTLRSPANNAALAGTAITFRWNAADRAGRYQVEIRRADNNQLFKRRNLGNVTQLRQAGFPNNGTTYKWRVRAGNLGGWGPFSAYRNVTSGRPPRVTLSSPANNATIAGAAITFRWNAARGANKYQVEIRRANNTVFKSRTLGNVLQLRQAGFPNNGSTYKWRVRAGNGAGWSAWSVYRNLNNGR